MAEAILTKIAVAAASAAGKAIAESVYKELFGSAESEFSKFMATQKAAFETLGNRLENTVLQKALDTQIVLINSWEKQLDERLAKANKGAPKSLKELFVDLQKSDTGISTQLDFVHAHLTGKAGPYSGRGVIGVYIDIKYKILETTNNFDYTIKDFLKDVNDFMDYHCKLQLNGFTMQLCSADQLDNTDKWTKEFETRLGDQLAYAYSLLPPALRKMKSSLVAPIDAAHWWQFRLVGDNGKGMANEPPGWYTNRSSIHVSSKPHPRLQTEWRFRPAPDAASLVELQFRESKRFVKYCRLYGDMHLAVENESEPQTLFKITPLADTANASHPEGQVGQWPMFRLCAVTVKDGNRQTVPPVAADRGGVLMGERWQLQDDGVGQWE